MVHHNSQEDVVFVVLDTLVGDDSIIRRFALKDVDVMPADVRPVVRGRWIPFTSEAAGDIWYCSACDIGFAHHMDFCPHCGADMRGGDAE